MARSVVPVEEPVVDEVQVPPARPATATNPPTTAPPQAAQTPGALVNPPAFVENPVKPASTPDFPAFRLRLDPDEIPSPEEIRPLLFPSTYSLSSDAQGFRFATREAFPGWNPTGLIPLAISAALPMFQDWRESNERERLSANLEQVGKALNDYQEKAGHFPPPAILDKQGKPLLSWRVGLLPSLGERALFDEFHLDEPWDSLHNKDLIPRMPAAYSHPTESAEPGLTFYRGVIGQGAFFDLETKDGLLPEMITDRNSLTLAVVEAREAVPWTKPGTEILFEGAPMAPLLGGHKPGGFAALFADGSFKFVRDSITPTALRAISTRAGGEAVSIESSATGVSISTGEP